MAVNTDPNLWINAASGVLLFAVGLVTMLVRPRTAGKAVFSAFVLAFGGRMGLGYANLIFLGNPASAAIAWTAITLTVIATLALPAFAGLFPRPIPRPRITILLGPLAVWLVYMAVHAFYVVRDFDRTEALLAELNGPANADRQTLDAAVVLALSGSFVFALLVMALRYRLSRGGFFAADRRHYLLMSFALVLWPAMVAGSALYPTGFHGKAAGWMTGILLLAVCVLWLWNTHGVSRPESRMSRDLAIACPALVLVGVAFTIGYAGMAAFTGPQFAFARMASLLLLAYAVLQHHLFGLDLKVKWTLSRGTVAAVVLAAFFVATSIAQNFLSQQYGWVYGGIATGVLLFFLSPLQRLGERVAEAALPGVKNVSHLATPEREAIYRRQALAAWADGNIDKSDRYLLDRLRESLRLATDAARHIEADVEREAPAAAPG